MSLVARAGRLVQTFLNPFFAFLTILLLVVTLAVQTRELEATQEQAADSAQSLRLQAASLEQQVFEQTFFQLLRVFNDVLASAAFSGHEGRHAMRALRDSLQGGVAHIAQNMRRPITAHDAHPDDIRTAYRDFYGLWEPQPRQRFGTATIRCILFRRSPWRALLRRSRAAGFVRPRVEAVPDCALASCR